MGKRLKRLNLLVRRRSHLTLLIIVGVIVLLLFFNDDTSLALNLKYQNEINRLQNEIKLNRDSAALYREKRLSVLAGRDELERLARERFNMQKNTEDVYVIK
ncbi:MAG: hypothetical protein J6C59_03985 [Muribaculaceae bacterium]|jgi:hypothetical protein|nr:hypothetical protein [Muribaculaceae bacterium]MCI5627175.1 hypothetical protein [Porphyromonadaceae bacterium]MDD6313873.1 hypothetical protein [Porphyromonadaceae bacterium]